MPSAKCTAGTTTDSYAPWAASSLWEQAFVSPTKIRRSHMVARSSAEALGKPSIQSTKNCISVLPADRPTLVLSETRVDHESHPELTISLVPNLLRESLIRLVETTLASSNRGFHPFGRPYLVRPLGQRTNCRSFLPRPPDMTAGQLAPHRQPTPPPHQLMLRTAGLHRTFCQIRQFGRRTHRDSDLIRTTQIGSHLPGLAPDYTNRSPTSHRRTTSAFPCFTHATTNWRQPEHSAVTSADIGSSRHGTSTDARSRSRSGPNRNRR